MVAAFPAEPPPVTSATYVDSVQEWLETLRVCLKFLWAMLIAAPLSDHTERPWQCNFQPPYNLAAASGSDNSAAAIATAAEEGFATPPQTWSRTVACATKAHAALATAAEAIDAATAAAATATSLQDHILSQQPSNPGMTADDAAAIKAAVDVAEDRAAAAAQAACDKVRPFNKLTRSAITAPSADASPAAAAPTASIQQSSSPSSADASSASASASDAVAISGQPSSSSRDASGADAVLAAAAIRSTQLLSISSSPASADASPASAAAPNTEPVSSQPSSSPATTSNAIASSPAAAAATALSASSLQQSSSSGSPSNADASPVPATAPNTEPVSSQPSGSPYTVSHADAWLAAAAAAAAVDTVPASTQPSSSCDSASDSDASISAAEAVASSIQQAQHALSQDQSTDTKRDGTKLPAVTKNSTFLPQENLDHTPLWPTPSAAAWADIKLVTSRTAVTLEWVLSKIFCDGKSQIVKQLKESQLGSIIVQLNSVLHITSHGHIADPKLDMSVIFWPLLRAATQNIVNFGCHMEIANDLALALMSRKAVDQTLFGLHTTMAEDCDWANRMLLLCCRKFTARTASLFACAIAEVL